MELVPALFIASQIALLVALVTIAGRRAGSVICRYFNPGAFFALFYCLFFIFPQLNFVLTDDLLVGFGLENQGMRQDLFFSAQWPLLLFLLSIVVGFASVTYLTKTVGDRVSADLRRPDNRYESIYLWICLAIGLAATIYLGAQFAGSRGFRSELVKSASGQLATSLAFVGNFAFAVLVFRSAQARRWLVIAGLITVFGLAVIMTGSRGRLLWPLVSAFILFVAARNRMSWVGVSVGGLLMFAVIPLIDPLRMAILDPNTQLGFTDIPSSIGTLFVKRNFDGFSNFSLIYYSDSIPHSLSYLFKGARDPFMNAYYPAVYRLGVGFGATLPGLFFISGGTPLIGFGAAFFGFGLALINAWLRSIRSKWLTYAYLFGIVWITAVGGNLIESLDKLVVAILPAILPALVGRLRSGGNDSMSVRSMTSRKGPLIDESRV